MICFNSIRQMKSDVRFSKQTVLTRSYRSKCVPSGIFISTSCKSQEQELFFLNFSFQLKLKNVNKTNCFSHLQRLCFNECVGLENIRRCWVPSRTIPPSLQVLISLKNFDLTFKQSKNTKRGDHIHFTGKKALIRLSSLELAF